MKKGQSESADMNLRGNFQDLTPLEDVDLAPYQAALDHAFLSRKIKNVAITGALGAGKSSVVESYLSLDQCKVEGIPIRISLVQSCVDGLPFDAGASTPESGGMYDEGEQQGTIDHLQSQHVNGAKTMRSNLQAEIINQIVSQLKPEEIRKSGFKRKIAHNIVDRQYFKFLLLAATLLIAVLLVGNFTSAIDKSSWENVSNVVIIALVGVCVFLLGSYYWSGTFGSLSNILHRIRIHDAEIELFNSSESDFDKYLSEILYLFEESKRKTVIFEDLDRFNRPDIFFQVRNLNFIINQELTSQRRAKGKSREDGSCPVKFVYLVRDDIFLARDKTKLFDFIIPIVRVIDGSNTYDYFRKQLPGSLMVPDVFLRQTSLYIRDARITKNICNEYIVYGRALSRSGSDKAKMMAMIVYKNLFPIDFGKLGDGRGFVAAVFSRKNKIYEKKELSIREEVTRIEEKIKNLDNILCDDINIVNAAYWTAPDSMQINGEYVARANKMPIDIMRMLNMPDAAVVINGVAQTAEDVLTPLSLNSQYSKTVSLIRDKADRAKEKYLNQINQLKQQLEVLATTPLYQLLQQDENCINDAAILADARIGNTEDYIFTVLDNEFFPLLKYYLQYGYINESYSGYLSYYHGTNFEDEAFLENVISGDAEENYSHLVGDPGYVVASMEPGYFRHSPATLNTCLMLYMLEHRDDCSRQLSYCCEQIITGRKWEFLFICLSDRQRGSLCLDQMLANGPHLFSDLHSDGVSRERLLFMLHLALRECPKRLLACSDAKSIMLYINVEATFFDGMVGSEIGPLNEIGVVFNEVPFSELNDEIASGINERNMYVSNAKNIFGLIRYTEGSNESFESFLRHPYDSVLASQDRHMRLYVQHNIDVFIGDVLQIPNVSIEDGESAVVDLLPRLRNESVVSSYVARLAIELNDIGVIDMEFWHRLLEANCVKPTINNLVKYFDSLRIKEIEQDGAFNDFLAQNRLANGGLSPSLPSDLVSDFRNYVLHTNISNQKKAAILKRVKARRGKASIEEWRVRDDGDVEFLIVSGLVELTSETRADLLRHSSNDLLTTLEQSDPESVLRLLRQGESIPQNELIQILPGDIGLKSKMILLSNFIVEPVSLYHAGISKNLYNEIFTNHFSENDLPYICRDYSSIDSLATKDICYSIIKDRVDRVVSDHLIIDAALFSRMMCDSDYQFAQMRGLCIEAAKSLPKREVIDAFKEIGSKEEPLILAGSSIRIPGTEENEHFLAICKERHWISSYSGPVAGKIWANHFRNKS